MFFERSIQNKIEKSLFKGKVVVVYGARQVGKTTLVKHILQNHPEKSEYYNCEESNVVEGLAKNSSTQLRQFFGKNKLVILDEAQKIRDIGTKLKLLVDTYPDLQIIATGSSRFALSNSVNEPLTGRKFEFAIYPLSFIELSTVYNAQEMARLQEHFFVYGTYPEIVQTSPGDAQRRLMSIAQSYLFKDLFTFQEIRNPEVLKKIVTLLAFQVGAEVSFDELAREAQTSIATVERYIRLLEEAFVVYRLTAFSRNARNEIKKSRKFYFYDNGIRNALVQNLSPIALRSDRGALWENFCITERMKRNQHLEHHSNRYFWRTYSQAEIDYIEERDGVLHAFEFTWSARRKKKLPKTFHSAYVNTEFSVITRENFLPFIGVA